VRWRTLFAQRVVMSDYIQWTSSQWRESDGVTGVKMLSQRQSQSRARSLSGWRAPTVLSEATENRDCDDSSFVVWHGCALAVARQWYWQCRCYRGAPCRISGPRRSISRSSAQSGRRLVGYYPRSGPGRIGRRCGLRELIMDSIEASTRWIDLAFTVLVCLAP